MAEADQSCWPFTIADARARHIDDSLRLFELYPQPIVWADIGSGAGFPGLVTAICLKELGGDGCTLLRATTRRAAFLRHVILETNARASVHPVRVEASYAQIGPVQAVSARALADLSDLLEPLFHG